MVSPTTFNPLPAENTRATRGRKTITIALVLFLSLLSAQCRNFGDFWGKKVSGGSGVTLLPNQVSPPVMSVPAGTYAATQNITLTSATPAATFCYTTDGVTTPTCDAATATCTTGTTYAGAINVTAPGATIMALACVANMINSPQSSAAYVVDTTPPVISLVSPASGYVQTTQVGYTLSENCATGSVTWTQTGGNPDPGSPRVQALVGAELTAATHSTFTLTNNPALVDGTTYSVQFDCTDAAGNAATPVTVTGVTYDAAAPVISGIAPTNGVFVTTTQVSYTLSETCQSGAINWTWTGGTAASNQTYPMAGGDLTSGTHTISPAVTLTAGAIYTVSFDCTDFAARVATTVSSTGVTFDNVAPVISAVTPANNSFINSSQVSYTLSETCASANIIWTQTSGSVDPSSPHNKSLTGPELTVGVHSNVIITNNPTLVSGAVYSIDFNCSDAAGNVATPVTVTNITFDNTSIVISAVTPASSSFRNITDVGYTLSEACASGTVTWTQTGGAADVGSPHAMALTGAELDPGAHGPAPLANSPILVDGAIYTVQFDCVDFAANAATPITVTNVTYDVTLPVISGVAPLASAFVNHQQVTYTLSETCATGGINWTWTSGTASSSFNQGLVAGELTTGVHGPFTISNNPTLVSGAVYTITFSCTDLAGNVAAPVTRTGVTFDNTPPTMVLQNLKNNGTVNTGHVIGTATDNVGVTVAEFNLDNTAFNPASYTAPNWKFALPMGGATWKDRSVHNIKLQARDQAGNVSPLIDVTVRKGNNQDVNGDGYGDAALSGWKLSTNTGAAYIFHGSSSGIAAANAAAASKIITGEATNNSFSRNMVLADFNGDGFGDLAVGASGYSSNTGRVYIFNGGAGGITPTSAAAAAVIINGAAAADAFGSNLNAGDITNDGYADLVVGANAAATSAGRTYIFFATGAGIASGSAPGANVIINGETSSQFGSGLALGDFNGDTLTDLAVTAPNFSSLTGRVYIFYNSAGSIPAGPASLASSIASGQAASDAFGGAISAGDINADGASDLVIGAYGASASTGKAYFYYGVNGGGIPTNGTASANATISGTNSSAFFTTSISTQDLNADGYADVAIGAYGCTASPAGCAYVFFGQAAPLGSGTAALAGYSTTYGVGGDNFGRGIGSFDVNGDGIHDLLVGANLASTSAGLVAVFPSTGAGPAAGPSTVITGQAGSEFGIHVSR